MKKVILGLFALTLIATSCKKGKDAPAITKENLAGSYKLTALSAKFGSLPEADVFAEMEACEQDDIYKFNLDNSFDILDAGTACDPTTEYSSDWALSGTQITIDGEVATVTNWDGTTLEVTGSYTDMGTTTTVKATYKKQ